MKTKYHTLELTRAKIYATQRTAMKLEQALSVVIICLCF